mmetsp:Transcript_61241/g.169506  ORF Transcript_61241/g.169506 Transcript_61241/m.169506 type:complete len:253 (+) Transcript_61241:140-898(+)
MPSRTAAPELHEAPSGAESERPKTPTPTSASNTSADGGSGPTPRAVATAGAPQLAAASAEVSAVLGSVVAVAACPPPAAFLLAARLCSFAALARAMTSEALRPGTGPRSPSLPSASPATTPGRKLCMTDNSTPRPMQRRALTLRRKHLATTRSDSGGRKAGASRRTSLRMTARVASSISKLLSVASNQDLSSAQRPAHSLPCKLADKAPSVFRAMSSLPWVPAFHFSYGGFFCIHGGATPHRFRREPLYAPP